MMSMSKHIRPELKYGAPRLFHRFFCDSGFSEWLRFHLTNFMFLCGQPLSLRDQFHARLFCISATNIKEGNTKQKKNKKQFSFLFMTLIYSLNHVQCCTSRFFCMKMAIYKLLEPTLDVPQSLFSAFISFHSHFVFHIFCFFFWFYKTLREQVIFILASMEKRIQHEAYI